MTSFGDLVLRPARVPVHEDLTDIDRIETSSLRSAPHRKEGDILTSR